MRVLIALLFACLASAAAAQGVDGPPVLLNANSCPEEYDLPAEHAPPGGWTGAEKYAWSQICISKWANMSYAGPDGYDGAACKPWEIDGEVPTHRILRPEFLHFVLTEEPWSTVAPQPWVAIRCAVFERQVYLANLNVRALLDLRDNHFRHGASLVGTRFARTLDFSGARFDSQLNADSMSVEGSLFLQGGASFQETVLNSAQIGGAVSAIGSTFEGTLNADSVTVGGSLFLQGGASFQEVVLRGAQIGGQISAIGATFEGTLAADSITVGGNMFLRDKAVFADINLSGARIASHLQLAGSQVSGEVNLSGAVVRELVLYHGRVGDTDWADTASLILRNASVQAVQSHASSWRTESGGALKVDLGGFAYQRLEGFGAGDQDTLIDQEATVLRDWLQGISAHKTEYDPQPYEQLASVLDTAGMTDKAKAIRYAKFEHRDATKPGTWWQAYLIRPAAKWIIGYGVYPFTALAWFFGMVGLGALVAIKSKDSYLAKPYRKAWYSLETALPLVEFSEAHKTINHENGWVESYFHAQKVLGFALATVLVGALTLLPG